MKILILLFLLPVSGLAQTLVEKRTGEKMTLTVIIGGEQANAIKVYRKTGVVGMPSLIGSMSVLAGVWTYQFQYVMPGGTTREYRFFAVPVKGVEFLEESNGVRVKRRP